MKLSSTLLAAGILLTAQTFAAERPATPRMPAELPPGIAAKGGYAEGSLLVRFKQNTGANQKANARGKIRSSLVRESQTVPGLEQLQLAPGMTVEKAMRIMNRLPFVEYAHPDYLIHIDQSPPDDAYWLEQWNLNNTGQASAYGAFLAGTPDADIDWLEGSALADGTGIVVAVMDTGIDYRHTDIAANVWINEAEQNGTPGVDDDNNGYIDDVRGWDFVNEDDSPLDGHGHGTHVAGIIGAVTDNLKGSAGMMPNGKVMALKVIGDDGVGQLSDAIEGLDYTTAKGIRISNNSWGYSEILPEEVADHNALYDTIQAANLLFIAAAGNDGIDTDTTPHYPSSFDLDNIISVSATDNTDNIAWFSSYGLTSVDVSAPGDVIMSTTKLWAGIIEDYAWESGTSLAAPHVAALAGLILQLEPNWTDQQVQDRIYATARPLPSLAGKSVTGAIINVYDALDGLPQTPVDIDVLPGDAGNQVYPNKTGKLPVAVLGSATFDATQVDPATVKFGAGQTSPTDAPVIANVDGLHGDDSTLRFQVDQSGILCNDTEVSLSGETYAGEEFTGTDTIDATRFETGGCHTY